MKRKMLSGIVVLLLCVTMILPMLTACDRGSDGAFSTDEHVTLNLALMHDQNSYITFNQASAKDPSGETGYLAADGTRYLNGDIKPVWKVLGERLNFSIVDKALEAGQTSHANMFDNKFKTGDLGEVHMINASASRIIDQAVTNDKFIDLKPYIEAGNMPNLKAFLDNNPIVAQQILANGGKMYYAPYFDGYDDLERMFMMRVDWVQELLDGATAPSFDTTPWTGDFAYAPFMPATMANQQFTIVKADGSATETVTKSYTKNIITVMDELTTKTGATLTQALRNYIDTTYGNYFGTNRSQLFVGQNAAYDPDELVALLRCVKANTGLLTGQTENAIVPFYPRNHSADRVMDVLRLAEIWGVRGLDARTNWYYVDKNGEIQDARLQSNTMDGIERLNQLYREGLIMQNYSTATSGDGALGDNTHRGRLNGANLGFMTYDYNQTTTVLNGLDETIEGFNLTPVLPPFTNWEVGDVENPWTNPVYTRFTDSWRSVKTDGYGIVKGLPEKITQRCLTLMDYLYSVEGNRLMSYGPEEWIDGTIEYNGRQVPKLSQAALDELAHYANGNYTNYYRRFLGGTFPIGYIKEQGMEYQCVHPKGQVGLDYILRAIELGTMDHLRVSDTANLSDPRLLTIPSAWGFTTQQQNVINAYTGNVTTNFKTSSSASGNEVLFTLYVINGFGDKTYSDTPDPAGTGYTKAELVKLLANGQGWGLALQLEFARVAYTTVTNG